MSDYIIDENKYYTCHTSLLYQSRAYKRGGELSTDHNPSYGLNTSQYRRTDSEEYEIPDYIIPSSAPPVQEAVYEGIN